MRTGLPSRWLYSATAYISALAQPSAEIVILGLDHRYHGSTQEELTCSFSEEKITDPSEAPAGIDLQSDPGEQAHGATQQPA